MEGKQTDQDQGQIGPADQSQQIPPGEIGQE